MNRELDARGKSCPLPVLEAKRAVEEMPEPGLLNVYVDNEIAVQNLLKLARQQNLAAVSQKLEEKKYRVVFDCPAGNRPTDSSREAKVSSPERADASAPEMAETSASKRKGTTALETAEACGKTDLLRTVVVLGADTMGTGEEALGRTLLKAFLFALSRQDKLPGTLLCYQRGAFLTCEGSEYLEDLRALRDRGVEILTCGTCLEYYGLQKKLAVGGVSNMYEIVQKMTEASVIIRP